LKEGAFLIPPILDFEHILKAFPEVAKGIPVALQISAISFVFGLILGVVNALVKIYNTPVLNKISMFYISIIRGTPLLVQVFLAYYGIPLVIRYINIYAGTDINIAFIPAIYFVCVALSLNAGAYMTEAIRAAILSVDKGQMEAAHSLGMTTFQGFKIVVFPQALKVGLPNIGNLFISLVKETSIAFVATVPEIMSMAKIIGGRTSRTFEAYLVAALYYWVICFALEKLLVLAEKRLRRNESGVRETKKNNKDKPIQTGPQQKWSVENG